MVVLKLVCVYYAYLCTRSEEWEKIDKASRDKIGLTFDDDGEFW